LTPLEEGTVKRIFTKLCEKIPKLRYKIVSIAGDYYYKMMSIEETIEKALPELKFKLKTKEDLKKFYE